MHDKICVTSYAQNIAIRGEPHSSSIYQSSYLIYEKDIKA